MITISKSLSIWWLVFAPILLSCWDDCCVYICCNIMPKVSKSSKLRHMKTGTTVRRELEVHSTWWNAVLTPPSSALGHFGTLGGLSRGGWPGSVDDCGYCILNKSTHKYKTIQVFLQEGFCKIFIQCILFFSSLNSTVKGAKSCLFICQKLAWWDKMPES